MHTFRLSPFSPVQGAACIIQVTPRTPPILCVANAWLRLWICLRKLPTLLFTYRLDPSGGNACGEQGISISGPICGEVSVLWFWSACQFLSIIDVLHSRVCMSCWCWRVICDKLRLSIGTPKLRNGLSICKLIDDACSRFMNEIIYLQILNHTITINRVYAIQAPIHHIHTRIHVKTSSANDTM